ncbi:unnamed protein product [Lactuca saligna]|uniref:Uncharacterized protein n=1 Tax=Lactuca saligna TaxID=75948 RepID=A0AA35VJ41_LACSI|nr:unnamed protein product [Lactuca saligna]
MVGVGAFQQSQWWWVVKWVLPTVGGSSAARLFWHPVVHDEKERKVAMLMVVEKHSQEDIALPPSSLQRHSNICRDPMVLRFAYQITEPMVPRLSSTSPLSPSLTPRLPLIVAAVRCWCGALSLQVVDVIALYNRKRIELGVFVHVAVNVSNGLLYHNGLLMLFVCCNESHHLQALNDWRKHNDHITLKLPLNSHLISSVCACLNYKITIPRTPPPTPCLYHCRNGQDKKYD